ncbi:MAG TPA: glycerol-3-phosphate dehydrogenase/oxidase [Herpetosiphon sp.]|uniref:FAD dependent oxidoreductase n=1 Tax=Herpetosiphon aurantiacus (strain ATCC 23779 / DSM 785 / 114-95) TaxID=316274 RepID=A9AU91_HERA2|nr:glycerol-3-phosphate dehydrogenase/oxidase [Herpetosiphon sp.]ABX03010.1 FAD dependent oxidoreductase [Herpetosiphon aurantiacus DSM 785]HBW50888.1 glycerol-3-phosphate dehydrogenase/oxidase [Herpetosiphon sp.]
MNPQLQWNAAWRETTWQVLDQAWDVIIIGGGITGAGLVREATRSGLKALLLEARDFAWGTSSRSSKLVHGGLRYLAQGQVRVTYDSVVEREQLLNEAPGLVAPLGFLIGLPQGKPIKRWVYQAGLLAYDALARRREQHYLSMANLRLQAPYLADANLAAGLRYSDAQTDDARLVLRILREATAAGASVLNYAAVEQLVRANEQVVGVVVRDQLSQRQQTLTAKAIVNATGAWVDQLRQQIQAPAKMRPLRGSHLVFSQAQLPLAQAINLEHPRDQRPVFFVPWEGVSIVGTTDLDHEQDLWQEPSISPAEVAYLLEAAQAAFPSLDLSLSDVISTWSGVRPVVDTGASDPSKESRDYVLWQEQGLLTVTGGKLTTFRLIALEALKLLRQRLPQIKRWPNAPRLNPAPSSLAGTLAPRIKQRLLGRYAAEAPLMLQELPNHEFCSIADLPSLWAEIRWAARYEAVTNLGDLLLRRSRLGLLLPHGAAEYQAQIQAICTEELGWDAQHWQTEWQQYQQLIAQHYSLPA